MLSQGLAFDSLVSKRWQARAVFVQVCKMVAKLAWGVPVLMKQSGFVKSGFPRPCS